MKTNIKMFLLLVAVIFIVALGGVFLFDKNKNIDTISITSENGSVAGETNIQNDDYQTRLAQFLASNGVVMYGSFQCEQCEEQKRLFSDAAKYLDYVECDPAGPDANPDECLAAKIDSYPTWIYEGKQYRGLLQLSQLARISNFSD